MKVKKIVTDAPTLTPKVCHSCGRAHHAVPSHSILHDDGLWVNYQPEKCRFFQGLPEISSKLTLLADPFFFDASQSLPDLLLLVRSYLNSTSYT